MNCLYASSLVCCSGCVLWCRWYSFCLSSCTNALVFGFCFLSSLLTLNAEGTNLVTSALKLRICGFAEIVAPCLLDSTLLMSWGAAERTFGVPRGKFGGPDSEGGGPGRRIILGGAGGIRSGILGGGMPGGGPGGRRGRPGGGPGGNLRPGPGYRRGPGPWGLMGWVGCGWGIRSVPGGTRGSGWVSTLARCSSSFDTSSFFWTTSISFMKSSTFCPDSATIFCWSEVGLTAASPSAWGCVDDSSVVSSFSSSVRSV